MRARSPAPGGPLSSATLLANARARQAPPPSAAGEPAAGGTGSTGGTGGRESEEADLLAARVVSFLDAQRPDREAESGAVVAAFRAALPDARCGSWGVTSAMM